MNHEENLGNRIATSYRQEVAERRQKEHARRRATDKDPARFSLDDVATADRRLRGMNPDYGAGVRWDKAIETVADGARLWWTKQLFKENNGMRLSTPKGAPFILRNTPFTRCLTLAQIHIAEKFALKLCPSELYFCGVVDVAPAGARSSEVILPVWRIFARMPYEQRHRWETFAYAFDGRNLFVW
jgi:hypothetical protein